MYVEDDIRKLFDKYGELAEVQLPTDDGKRSKGYGFVAFVVPEIAIRALEALDGTSFLGRTLHIIPSKGKPASVRVEEAPVAKNYKEQKAQDLAKGADNDNAWNALFIRSDTVVEALSHSLDVKKV